LFSLCKKTTEKFTFHPKIPKTELEKIFTIKSPIPIEVSDQNKAKCIILVKVYLYKIEVQLTEKAK
jgi:hypothetical protein